MRMPKWPIGERGPKAVRADAASLRDCVKAIFDHPREILAVRGRSTRFASFSTPCNTPTPANRDSDYGVVLNWTVPCQSRSRRPGRTELRLDRWHG
jgi:hypothetical protein